MRIHAIQTGTVAVKEGQRSGSRGHGPLRLVSTLLGRTWTEPLPIYAWAIEHPEGVIVVDTGETARTADPGYLPGWHPYYRFGVRFWVEPEDEIGPQLRQLGIAPGDVRRLIMTHLHTDHAGGLHHFPESEILVSPTEYAEARGRAGLVRGYPSNRWPDWFAPRPVAWTAEALGPFPMSFPVTQAKDVWLVPTPGHTPGHLSVIVQDGERTFFLAGDTSYTQALMLDQVVDGVTQDTPAAQQTLQRIRQFVAETPTVYLPSHDAGSAQRLAARDVAPVGAVPQAAAASTRP